ncbi:helix-turn-helix domain-containing protein [Actinocrispum wychmicini]|uniref:GAF domain-containing protein n=1 Tax=Actinocrispum wychmicini TaxID=1213861 RepID=A0A4R2K0J4_9PSEU|nr:GAF domain-containing protein [Actinocrispum wychmicini]TCO65177.1 GAF domain-containing protein [Actinocrispum wychmicini]
MARVNAFRELLDLLAADADGEQLTRLAAARAPGMAPAEAAEWAAATEAALAVRHTLVEHQRREAELSALVDTASDLARLRDPDAVLRSIVHRARILLGVDVSYLSLNDDSGGQTYMRVTEGSVSALFQELSLGFAEGLGGLVAQTARPYATPDYFADTRFKHTHSIDTAVHEEGLVSIIGVPLTLGSRVIGVLYAADRAPRTFSRAEVALLSSLADHAAVAIDNAELLAETRRVNSDIRRASEVHDRLTALVLRGADVLDVVSAVAQVLSGGIALFDAAGVLLASVGASAEPPSEMVVRAQSSGRAVSNGDVWVCAALAGPELLGSLVLTGRVTLPDADRLLFERAGLVTALLLLLRRSVAHAEEQVRGELLTDLLTGRSPSTLVARGRRLGVDLTVPYTVFIAHADGVSRGRLAAAAAGNAALVGVYAEQVVLLAPGNDTENDTDSDPDKLARTLAGAVGCPVTVGAAGPATGPAELAAAHAEAGRCLNALRALGQTGKGASLAGLGFVGVLLGDRADVDGFLRATLGPVLDYDRRRGTELVRTLRSYFDCGGSLTRAKDVLHVHVNTVVQRLDRIASLLGEDWQSPDRALEIHLALRVLAVRS